MDDVALDVRVQRQAERHRSLLAGRERRLDVDATFYDSEAFTRPLHIVTPWNRTAGIEDAQHRFTYVECRVQSTIVNDADGRPTQLTPADDGYIDYFGRPWAENWERHFEQGWEKPAIK